MNCRFCNIEIQPINGQYPLDCGSISCDAAAMKFQRDLHIQHERSKAAVLWASWLKENRLNGYDFKDDRRDPEISKFLASWKLGQSAWIACRLSGIGKTWLAVQIAKRAMMEHGQSAYYLDSVRLSRYGSSHGDGKQAFVDEFRSKSIIILDDIDKMLREASDRKSLWELIKLADDQDSAFVSTSNMLSGNIAEWIGVGKFAGVERIPTEAQKILSSAIIPIVRRIRENSIQLEK